MREIKFRGKGVSGKWIYGDLIHGFVTGDLYINGSDVDAKTVGQYTGLKDKNGVEIYEGDIVKQSVGGFYWVHEIKSLGGQFGNTLFAILLYSNRSVEEDTGTYTYQITTESAGSRNYIPCGEDVEVTGNIHEHPELLEVVK